MSPSGPETKSPPPSNANDFIEQQLNSRIADVEKAFDADTIAFHGPLYGAVDDFFRKAVERKHKENPERSKSIVMLTTRGGYIQTVHRMVDTLRWHYKTIEFVVPNYAYSAGTIFVMSGDAIHVPRR